MVWFYSLYLKREIVLSVVAPAFSGETPFISCLHSPPFPARGGVATAGGLPPRDGLRAPTGNPGLGWGFELLFWANGEKGQNRRGLGRGGQRGLYERAETQSLETPRKTSLLCVRRGVRAESGERQVWTRADGSQWGGVRRRVTRGGRVSRRFCE